MMSIQVETPPHALAPPRLRPATFDDDQQIARLESAHGLLSLSPGEWRAIWTDNPVRGRLGNDWPIGWVLEDDSGQIVGSLANIPTLYRYRGQSLLAATGRGWVVSPDYRGAALWLMDEYFHQDGVDLFINTTVNGLAQSAFGAFGSVRVPLGDWETASYWVTHHQGFAKAALRIKGAPMPTLMAGPLGLALKVKDALNVAPLSTSLAAGTIDSADSFDGRFDAFWDELASRAPERLLCVRDRETLSWHFGPALRAGRARVFTASRDGLLRAYCVLKRQDHPPSGLVRMRLADYQTLDVEEARDPLPGLLRASLAYCTGQGIHTLEYVGGGLPKMKNLDRFAPYRRDLGAWPFFYRADDPALAAELRNPSAWDPSSYDGDASL